MRQHGNFAYERLISMVTVVCAVVLLGCERVASHPAVPPQAGQLIRESMHAVRDLKGDVDRFVSGFNFHGAERSAVSQMTRAMFGVFQINDTGSAVRAAIEIKRAQGCLAMVGIEASGIMQELQDFLFRDEKAQRWWLEFEVFMANLEMPDFSGAMCDHAKLGAEGDLNHR